MNPNHYRYVADALDQAIRNFYDYLEKGMFISAYGCLDDRLRQQYSKHQYMALMDAARFSYGTVTINKILMEVHLGENTKLYGNRDYAIGTVWWKDYTGGNRIFHETWVKDYIWKNWNVTPKMG